VQDIACLSGDYQLGGLSMGARIKDSTTLDILVQLNKRFDVEMVSEMAALQKEFKVFSGKHSLRQSFALLGLVPAEASERARWYSFLDFLKTYKSDLKGVNGHDRVVKLFKNNLESSHPLPVHVTCHAAADDAHVKVSQGHPLIFSLEQYAVLSIPTTPGRVARQQAADTAKKRRAGKGKKE
jgi:hypothetical protein